MRLSLDRKSARAWIGSRTDREGDPERDMGVHYADVESNWNNSVYCPRCICQSGRLNNESSLFLEHANKGPVYEAILG